MNKEGYVTQVEAAQHLGVTRATLYYYMKSLSIEPVKFRLDRHAYLRTEDFEKIVAAKEGSVPERGAASSTEESISDKRS